MGEKNCIEVEIAGKLYKISGSEDTAYINRVAAYVNNKLEEIKGIEGFNKRNRDYQELMIYLNIADDYFQIKDKGSNSDELARLEEASYQLKCELVDLQMKLDTLEKNSRREKNILTRELENKILVFEKTQKENEDLKQQLDKINQDYEAKADKIKQSYEEKLENYKQRLQAFQDKFHEVEKNLAQDKSLLDEQNRLLKEKDDLLREQTIQLNEQTKQLENQDAIQNEKVKQMEAVCQERCIKRDEAWREKLKEMQEALDSSENEQINLLDEIENYKKEIEQLKQGKR